MTILLENLSKNYGSLRALRNVNLEIPTGSLTALVGPSGSGKSTLLRIRAGFEVPDTGRVWLDGQNITERPPAEREFGVVFQNYALFPHRTAYENVSFGLERRGIPEPERSERVNRRLNLVGRYELADRYPNQLSGGQRQRIALARALAPEPNVLLLDEPFAALDPKVRRDLREWIRRLHEEVCVTILLVTHDQQEAREVADQLVVFRNGRREQADKPTEIYDWPANGFVRGFVGHASQRPETGPLTPGRDFGPTAGLVRPHGWILEKEGNGLPVEVKHVCYGETLVSVEVTTPKNTTVRLQIHRRRLAGRKPGMKAILKPRSNA